MSALRLSHSIKFPLFVIFLVGCLSTTSAQDEKKTTAPAEANEKTEQEIIKVSTDLIQTGVAVFNKKGQFVKNLKLEDFQLSVDGKPVPVSFFEQNTSNEETIKPSGEDETKTVSNGVKSGTSISVLAQPPGRGRTIIFVVDDLHLSFDSHFRTRKLILKFIEQEMMAEDTVAIVSSTGKIGFLQQFTNDKRVLRAAVTRLIFARARSIDHGVPPMSEYEALLITQFDSQVTDIFAAREFGGDMDSRREIVRSRARTITMYAASINRGTYSTLERAIRNSGQLPGRKVVFFISDGFLLDPSNTDSPNLMRRITDAAARTNTVIYSLHAKGLEAGFPEGTTAASLAVGYRVQSGERFESQDGLSLLADETGGRFVHNTNDLQTGLKKSIDEASQYYLLAWQPVSENARSEKFRKIKVTVKNRPELKVRVHGGYLDENLKTGSDEKSKTGPKKGAKPQTTLTIPEQQLRSAAGALTPARMLPTSLTVNYLDMPNEAMLVAVALQIKSGVVEFTAEAGDKAKANIDLLGGVYDSNGKRVGFFRELLTVSRSASALSKIEPDDIYHNYQTRLKPGLYQVRVAARDVKSGRVGSAVQWIEIPDLSTRRLALSSLILSERAHGAEPKQEATAPNNAPNNAISRAVADEPIIVDRRFARTSELRYRIFIYNAAHGRAGSARPDVTVQTQILRGRDVVVTNEPSSVSTDGQDLTRLPYAAEVSLRRLPAGRYELLVVVQDRIAKSNSVQRVGFEVE